MKIFFSTIIFIGLLFSGCGTPKATVKNAKPSWISKHQDGAVGICKVHMKGTSAQEETAQDRARTILAKNKSSYIGSSSIDSQNESAGRYTSSHQSVSRVQANTEISSHIKDSWRDPRTGTYYVWMVLN